MQLLACPNHARPCTHLLVPAAFLLWTKSLFQESSSKDAGVPSPGGFSARGRVSSGSGRRLGERGSSGCVDHRRIGEHLTFWSGGPAGWAWELDTNARPGGSVPLYLQDNRQRPRQKGVLRDSTTCRGCRWDLHSLRRAKARDSGQIPPGRESVLEVQLSV